MTLVDFHHVELRPPPNSTCPHTDMHIQTDGDNTKHVVIPFGTTRLKRDHWVSNNFRHGNRVRGAVNFCLPKNGHDTT